VQLKFIKILLLIIHIEGCYYNIEKLITRYL